MDRQPCQEIEYRQNTIDTVNEGKEGKIVLVNAPVRIKIAFSKIWDSHRLS